MASKGTGNVILALENHRLVTRSGKDWYVKSAILANKIKTILVAAWIISNE